MMVRRHCEVLSETSRYFTERGVRPRFSFRTTNDDKTLALVRAGLGITLMPDSYRDPEVARPRLCGFDQTRKIGSLPGKTSAPVPQPVLDVLRTTTVDRKSAGQGKSGDTR